MRTRSFATAIALATSAIAAEAQQYAEAPIALRAAALAVRQRLPRGAIAVDPRVVMPRDQYRNTVWPQIFHDTVSLLVMQQVLGGRIAPYDSVVVCEPNNVRTCRLRDGIAIVAFEQPVVSGDTATVSIYLTSDSGTPQTPLVRQDLTLTLVKVGGNWGVVDIRVDRP